MGVWNQTCNSKNRLEGKTVVITGANTGIGKETARDLYRRGARVILACRDIGKANAALEDIKNLAASKYRRREEWIGGGGQVVTRHLDLANFASVRRFAKQLADEEANLDILINNAGVVCSFGKTVDGFETQWQVNYLSHFLLTLLLLPKLACSSDARIINVSSIIHYYGSIEFDDINLERSYSPVKAYCQSKLANVLFTKELARRTTAAEINWIRAYCLHPGLVATEMSRNLDSVFFRGAKYAYERISRPFIKNPRLGAQTLIHCAVDAEGTRQTGLFYRECRVARPSARARNDQLADRLWKASLKFVGFQDESEIDRMIESLNSPTRP